MSMSSIGLPRIQSDYRRSRTRPVQTEKLDLWTMLENPTLSQGYRHLTLTLLANGPDCAHVRDGMDAFVLAELRGDSTHRSFPEHGCTCRPVTVAESSTIWSTLSPGKPCPWTMAGRLCRVPLGLSDSI